jgi:hypothetical protein
MKVRNVNKKRVKHPMTLRTHYKRCYWDWCERGLLIASKTPTLPTIEEALAEYEHDLFMRTQQPPTRRRRPLDYFGDNDIKLFAYEFLGDFCYERGADIPGFVRDMFNLSNN